jgi:hypothetical protein
VADSASGWGANCHRFAIGPRPHPNRRARADPDSLCCQSVYLLCQRSRCGSGCQPDGSSYWRFVHCCPRRSPARMALGVGTSPTHFHRARNPARVRAGQNCQAAAPGENCLLLSYMARRQRRSIRPMGVRRQNRSRLAVWMALVADQDSGRGFLRRGADVGLLWRATDRRPYNATFLPVCLSICWKCCYRAGIIYELATRSELASLFLSAATSIAYPAEQTQQNQTRDTQMGYHWRHLSLPERKGKSGHRWLVECYFTRE